MLARQFLCGTRGDDLGGHNLPGGNTSKLAKFAVLGYDMGTYRYQKAAPRVGRLEGLSVAAFNAEDTRRVPSISPVEEGW